MSHNLIHLLPDKPQVIRQLSVDCVIFGFHNQQLKVLLLKIRHLALWALPGGYVFQHEGIEQAASRVLEERTGLKDIYLEQFRTFGEASRSTREVVRKILETDGLDPEAYAWMQERFVTVGYYALVDFSEVKPMPDPISEACEWVDINRLPALAFDHEEIVKKALETLQLMLDHRLVGFNLLPDMFTMNELQSLYETISGLAFRRNNFQRKMLALGILERLEKKVYRCCQQSPVSVPLQIQDHSVISGRSD